MLYSYYGSKQPQNHDLAQSATRFYQDTAWKAKGKQDIDGNDTHAEAECPEVRLAFCRRLHGTVYLGGGTENTGEVLIGHSKVATRPAPLCSDQNTRRRGSPGNEWNNRERELVRLLLKDASNLDLFVLRVLMNLYSG